MTRLIFRSREVADALGVSTECISRLVKSGVVVPVEACLTGEQNPGRFFTIQQVMAIAIARHSRAKGFSVDQSFAIAEWILKKHLDQILTSCRDGKPLLMVVGDVVRPDLLSYHDVFSSNGIINLPARMTSVESKSPLIVVDLWEAFKQLCGRLDGVVTGNAKEVSRA